MCCYIEKDKVFLEKIESMQDKDKEVKKIKECIRNRKSNIIPNIANINLQLKWKVLFSRENKVFYMITDTPKGTEEIMGMIGWAVRQRGEGQEEWHPISF